MDGDQPEMAPARRRGQCVAGGERKLGRAEVPRAERLPQRGCVPEMVGRGDGYPVRRVEARCRRCEMGDEANAVSNPSVCLGDCGLNDINSTATSALTTSGRAAPEPTTGGNAIICPANASTAMAAASPNNSPPAPVNSPPAPGTAVVNEPPPPPPPIVLSNGSAPSGTRSRGSTSTNARGVAGAGRVATRAGLRALQLADTLVVVAGGQSAQEAVAPCPPRPPAPALPHPRLIRRVR